MRAKGHAECRIEKFKLPNKTVLKSDRKKLASIDLQKGTHFYARAGFVTYYPPFLSNLISFLNVVQKEQVELALESEFNSISQLANA